MIAQEVRKLENENLALKEALKELEAKMAREEVLKPKSCKYCKNFVQHYMRDQSGVYKSEYTPIYAGHCLCNVPTGKRIKKGMTPDDTCQFFEFGVYDLRN